MSASLLSSEMRTNFHNLYADIFWFGVLAGSAMAFLGVFAARQGATSFQVSLLSAGPGLVNLLFSMPAGRWLEKRPLIGVAFWSSVWHRLGYLLLIPLPWLLPAPAQVWGIGFIVLVMSVPGTLLAIAFNAMFAEVVAPDWRAQVVGKRNALLSISMTVTSLLSGQVLDRLDFPGNYQVVFAAGAMGAILSSYHLARIRSIGEAPVRVWRLLMDPARPGMPRFLDAFRGPLGLRFLTRSGGRSLLRLELLKGSFGPFLLAFLLFYAAQYASIPLYPLFFVNDLKLTDGQISLGSALFYGAMFLASLGLNRVSAHLGHRKVMILGALLYGSYPLLNFFARDATLFWFASLCGGGVTALTIGGLVNRLMERVPEGDRPAHMALHNLALNIGILGGSLLGPLVANWVGLRDSLLLNAGMRFFAGLLLAVFG